jgi:predicted nucleic acid-binding protein
MTPYVDSSALPKRYVAEPDSARAEHLAASIAEELGVRTLDALHLSCAQRPGANTVTSATFDLRQAQAARALGMIVLGAWPPAESDAWHPGSFA